MLCHFTLAAVKGMMPPSIIGVGTSQWVGALHVEVVDQWPPSQHAGYLPISLPPFHLVGLACCDPVQ